MGAAFVFALIILVTRVFSIRGVSDFRAEITNNITKNEIEWGNFFVIFFSAFLLGGSITLIFRFANILFNQAYSFDVSQASILLGFDKVVSIIGAICAPVLVKKFNLKLTLLFIGISTFIFLFAQSLVPPLALFIVLYFSRLILNYVLMPILDTLTITGFNKSRVLISSSVRQVSFYLGSACAAIIYGELFQNHNWTTALLYSAIMALSGAFLLSLIREYQKT
jgi:predicted MFS family arabinose efflux permease